MQYFADHKNIRKIYLCLDNDIAGNAACENLAEKIPNDKVVMRLVEALLIHGEPLVLQDSSIFKEKNCKTKKSSSKKYICLLQQKI